MAPLASPSNPYKRHIDAVQNVYECAKRRKTSQDSSGCAHATVADGESIPAPTGKSEDPAGNDEVDSDDESWVSDSSEGPSDESSEECSDADDAGEEEEEQMDENLSTGAQDVVNLRANRGKRPEFKLPGDEELEDIRPFLKDFLPKLKAANEELEAQKATGTLQTSEMTGEEGSEQYIELNLGLGVLEEKNDDAHQGAHETLDHEDEDGNTKQRNQENDILGKLMGRKKPVEPVGIQEVADTQDRKSVLT